MTLYDDAPVRQPHSGVCDQHDFCHAALTTGADGLTPLSASAGSAEDPSLALGYRVERRLMAPPGTISVALAAVSIFTMGGVIFGIASLYPVLHYERAMEASCGSPATSDDGMTCTLRSRDACGTIQ